MARRRRQAAKTIPMKVGNDPACWRYGSMEEALTAGTAVLVQLIRDGEQLSEADTQNDTVEETPLEVAPV